MRVNESIVLAFENNGITFDAAFHHYFFEGSVTLLDNAIRVALAEMLTFGSTGIACSDDCIRAAIYLGKESAVFTFNLNRTNELKLEVSNADEHN